MSKFDKIIPKGSVPNCQLQIANRYDNRWFKCKLKPPKNKAIAPSTMVIFLGILFNTISMTLSITKERLQEITNLLEHWLKKETASLKEVQSLLVRKVKLCRKYSKKWQSVCVQIDQ